MARLNEAARLVKSEDTQHPVATIYGELPDAAVLAAMSDIDIWGINAYRGISFGDLFDGWQARSDKPMFIAEYGADAYNANAPAYDPESQSQAVVALTTEILDHVSATGVDRVALGGTLFEWADEWWKDESGESGRTGCGRDRPRRWPLPRPGFQRRMVGARRHRTHAASRVRRLAHPFRPARSGALALGAVSGPPGAGMAAAHPLRDRTDASPTWRDCFRPDVPALGRFGKAPRP